jgi:beta-phosphoglucomutase
VIPISFPIKAFIFDMDGVLTETVSYHYRSWQRLASELNIEFSAHDNEQMLGLSRPDSLKLFLRGKTVSEAEFQRLLRKKNEYYLEMVANFTPANLLPGVAGLLHNLKQTGYRLAVASSSRNTQFILNRLQIRAFFEAVSDSNTVVRAKPAPDLFLKAAGLLGVLPEECVVVEDSAAGVAAGLAAGMTVVGIGRAELIDKAHFRYGSMAEVNLDEIVSRCGN